MSVTRKSFHLPPYISTGWGHVVSLHMEHEDHEQLLVVTLTNGAQICIPNLDERLIRQIFQVHAEVLETSSLPTPVSSPIPEFDRDSARMRAGRAGITREGDELGALLDTQTGFPSFLSDKKAGLFDDLSLDSESIAELERQLFEHRPELALSPALPSALLQRMSMVGKFLHPGLLEQLPRATEGCGCPFCQIHRVLHGEPPDTALPPIEDVCADDLQFRSWSIVSKGENLYEVANSEDPQEIYQVFLGEPLGCTCGQAKCEHLRVVLQSE